MPKNEILESSSTNKESNRLKKLERYEILQTQPELAFDTLAKLGSDIFNANYAAISFVGDHTVFHKANTGNTSINVDKLCLEAIEKAETTIAQFSDNGQIFIAVPLITPEGFIVGIINALLDSEVKPSERQIEMLKNLSVLVIDKLETRLALRQTMRAQDHRVNMLVHDLKNPMTTISLQAELVGKMPGIDERTKVISGKINSQSKKIIESLNHIVSTARSENASVKFQKAKVNLKLILEKIALDFDLRLKTNGLVLLQEVSEPIEVYGDEEKLYIIFEELMNNAIQFSPSGEKIQIKSLLNDNTLIISIKDNGVGIIESDLERLFVKFANVGNFTKKTQRGEGLGLLLARTLVDLHKGKLWADSEGKDKGATFQVEFPLK